MAAVRRLDAFRRVGRIGEGTYGVVYKAEDRESGEVVALKEMRDIGTADGFPITTLREIKILREIKHPHMVDLKEVVVGGSLSSLALVFEYCEHDLAALLDAMGRPFSEPEVKTILHQLLSVVVYLHRNWIVHRDIKFSNLLYTSSGALKLADFGLAREVGVPTRPISQKVVTLWYRAPEILLGAEMYSRSVDIWSIGCIFGELLLRKPILPGHSEVELILKLLGSPTESVWPGCSKLPVLRQLSFPVDRRGCLSSVFSQLSDNGLDLLRGMLCYDPARRLTAVECLDHPYFREQPPMQHPEMMPTFRSLHPQFTPAHLHARRR